MIFFFHQAFVGKVFFCIYSANVVKFVGSLVLLSDCKALLNHWEIAWYKFIIIM